MADGINFVDLQGGEALVSEAKARREAGGALYLVNTKMGLWESLERCGCLDAIGMRHVFQSKRAAVRAIFQKLDKDVCARCDKRVFSECQSIPVPEVKQ